LTLAHAILLTTLVLLAVLIFAPVAISVLAELRALRRELLGLVATALGAVDSPSPPAAPGVEDPPPEAARSSRTPRKKTTRRKRTRAAKKTPEASTSAPEDPE
jgi:hypothetical protein